MTKTRRDAIMLAKINASTPTLDDAQAFFEDIAYNLGAEAIEGPTPNHATAAVSLAEAADEYVRIRLGITKHEVDSQIVDAEVDALLESGEWP